AVIRDQNIIGLQCFRCEPRWLFGNANVELTGEFQHAAQVRSCHTPIVIVSARENQDPDLSFFEEEMIGDGLGCGGTPQQDQAEAERETLPKKTKSRLLTRTARKESACWLRGGGHARRFSAGVCKDTDARGSQARVRVCKELPNPTLRKPRGDGFFPQRLLVYARFNTSFK